MRFPVSESHDSYFPFITFMNSFNRRQIERLSRTICRVKSQKEEFYDRTDPSHSFPICFSNHDSFHPPSSGVLLQIGTNIIRSHVSVILDDRLLRLPQKPFAQHRIRSQFQHKNRNVIRADRHDHSRTTCISAL